MADAIQSERPYPIRRPLAAFWAGAAVAILGGLIGLGGAEFHLPLLIAVFELYPQRAVRINLLISLATLLAAGAARAAFIASTNVPAHAFEICGMVAGGVVAAWIGAGVLGRLPKARVTSVIAVLLTAIAGLLVAETLYAGAPTLVLPNNAIIRTVAAVAAGILVGGVSSMLGVAGGELIIPIMIFLFGADIRTAGSASILISIPIVVTGVARHMLTGHFRSRSMLAFLVLPMSAGSLLGAIVGGFAAAYAPTDTLRVVLAIILALSAAKLMRKH